MRELREALTRGSSPQPPASPDGDSTREGTSGTGFLDDGFLLDFHSTCAHELASQLLDLRSEVVKEASACVSALTARGGANRVRFPAIVLEAFAPALLRLLAVPQRLLADQGLEEKK